MSMSMCMCKSCACMLLMHMFMYTHAYVRACVCIHLSSSHAGTRLKTLCHSHTHFPHLVTPSPISSLPPPLSCPFSLLPTPSGKSKALDAVAEESARSVGSPATTVKEAYFCEKFRFVSACVCVCVCVCVRARAHVCVWRESVCEIERECV